MTDGARREYAAALRERYAAADKRGRGQILDEYCRTTGCHRKTAIRRLARPEGVRCYSTRAAFTVLPQLYVLLRLPLNFFRPVRKLLSKQRVGSKVIKRYDAPQTPCQRALAAGVLAPAHQRALAHQVQALDPVALAHDIARRLDMLWTLADTRRTSAH